MFTEQETIKVLQISKSNVAIATGIYIPEALMSFDDNDTSVISYPDTGVFVLLRGSYTSSTENKYKPYIGKDRKTTREIVFQSRNAAAQFVLGNQGCTNCWQEQK